MCVLALFVDCFPEAPLIVAANRDEFVARPAAPPQELEPGIVGGKDLQGGGTWLGVNRHGVFVAVTNRLLPARMPNSYSRGRLTLEALRCRGLDEIEDLVRRRVGERPVAGFNLVALAGGAGRCLHYDGALRPAAIGAGRHVVSTHRDLDDPAMPERRTFERFAATLAGVPDDAALAGFLASHEGERPVCKHREGFGTVSSTIYRRARDGTACLLHADGPPCTTPFRDLSDRLAF